MLFLWLVLIQIVIFAALVLFLRMLLTKNVTNATTHLDTLNQDYSQKLDDAKKRQAEADTYYDSTILKSKVDAEKAKVAILKEAHDAQEFMVNQSRAQSTAILEQANKARETILGEIEARIEASAIQKACELVQEILPAALSEPMHVKWVDDLFKNNFEQLDRLNLPENLKEIEIQTAYALSDAHKKAMEKKIKSLVSKDVKLVEKVDSSLIAGCKVVLGTVVIDGTLKLKIKETMRHVQQPS